jgi:hypothetical protein
MMSTGTEYSDFEHADSGQTGIERRLKAQIDRYPVRLRPELAREAYQAHRRHRVVTRAAATAGLVVLVVAAIAVGTGAVPFSAGDDHPSGSASTPLGKGAVPPSSFQPTPAPDNLTRQQASGDIFFVRQTTGQPSSGDTFFYGSVNRSISYDSYGMPAYDDSDALVRGKDGKAVEATTIVRYAARTWTRGTLPSPAATPKSPSRTLCSVAQDGGLNNEDPTQLMKGASSLLTCPGLTVTRGQRIHGVDAIKISRLNNTLWMNAITDLPIQAVTVNAKAPKEDITQFGYFPPTQANRARYLTTPIPHGFTQAAPPGPEPTTTVPVQPWTPPAGAISPFGLKPVPASDGLTASQAAGDILWTRSTTEAIPASDTLLDNIFS